MDWRDLGFYARARLSRGVGRWLNGAAAPPKPAAPLDEVLRGARTPLALTAARVAELRGEPLASLGPVMRDNARRLFGLD